MGIYIHVPFCKQACHYCDFHFSTSLKHKSALVNAICKELEIRKNELNLPIQTIYFGGGTPSLLTEKDLKQIFNTINHNFNVIENAEITLEANPDDLSESYLKMLQSTPINRLSIGVQSFFESDLKLMNRAHNSIEAEKSIHLAKKYFNNISIDLIYGIPDQTKDQWIQNLEKVIELDIPHVSSYALTVEPNTALHYFIEKEVIPPVDDDLAKEHFQILIEVLKANGFDHYEFSNFSKPDFSSKNNTAYWTGKNYLGIGPSAHSLIKNKRSWNVANNIKYIKAIQKNILPADEEILDKTDRYNEYIMTRLRTKWGIDLNVIEKEFGSLFKNYAIKLITEKLKTNLLIQSKTNPNIFKIHPEALFLTDGVSAELFMLKLNTQ
ncbi:coproporphyrinogen III oxidase [Psychroflexus salis]|uniref:Heme chaperone HemW n=2 Tax=Psychroflexus salis TaxID=1526574 RepID=A0A916ZN51_9FLAO|nr:coproporphyrinogen III oxidase [Psychroflexus salis]